MPKTVIPVRFIPDQGTGYLQDTGLEIAANSRFNLPPDLTEANASTILASIGAQPLSALGSLPPCGSSVGSKLRRLRFLRSNGGSMSVPVSSRADLIGAATVIKGIIDGTSGAEVVCIKLEGEEFPDLADDLGMAYDGSTVTSHVSVGESKQFRYSGQVAYQFDGVLAGEATVFQSISSITNNENAPATQVASAWANCVGPFENALPCRGKGRRNPRKHRRFDLTFAVAGAVAGDGLQTETIELPVVSSAASDILSCGAAAAALQGAYCIGYRGESYDSFDKLLAS